MRISRLFPCFLALFVLSGCGGGPGPEELAAQIEAGYAQASEVDFAAHIRADYGDRVYDFTVSCSSDAGGGVLTVAEPELIAGVTVRFSPEGAVLGYDGAEVFTGEILPEGLTPVDAVPMLLNLWRGGLVTEAVFEKRDGEECLAALYHVSDRVESRTWFERDTWLPLKSEVYLDGYAVIVCDFYNVRAE